jgi:hypothetical protein
MVEAWVAGLLFAIVVVDGVVVVLSCQDAVGGCSALVSPPNTNSSWAATTATFDYSSRRRQQSSLFRGASTWFSVSSFLKTKKECRR